jgi:hypothetical protein
MEESRLQDFDEGFVVLLDALGTKGVWDRPEGVDYADRLNELIIRARGFDPMNRGLSGSFVTPDAHETAEKHDPA